MILGDLVNVEVEVNHLCIRGENLAQLGKHFGQQVGADSEHDVALLHDRQAVGPEHVAGHPLVERMGVIDIHFAGISFPDFGADGFREAGELVLRPRIGDAVARDDHGLLRAGQQLRRLADLGVVRSHAR